MKRAALLVAIVLCVASVSVAVAGESESPPGPMAPPVELRPLLEQVTKADGHKFLVGAGVPPRVFAGDVGIAQVTYPVLLAILRNNDLVAMTVQGVTSIVPASIARTFPMPIVNADDPNIADDEWVTRVVPLKHAEASQTIPILRPMMQQQAHMAASVGQNAVLMTDRYGNVKRLTAILLALDEMPQTRRSEAARK